MLDEIKDFKVNGIKTANLDVGIADALLRLTCK